MSPRLISHRGKIDLDSPENDLVGIQEAIDLGVDMVEFDVRRTNDGILVCYHDADINGTPISELSFKEVNFAKKNISKLCLLYTSPSPRDLSTSRMPSSA